MERAPYNILEFLLNIFGSELLAEWCFPQQHITVVGQQFRTLGLWLSLCPDPAQKNFVICKMPLQHRQQQKSTPDPADVKGKKVTYFRTTKIGSKH